MYSLVTTKYAAMTDIISLPKRRSCTKTSWKMSRSNLKILHISLKGWESNLFLRKQMFFISKKKHSTWQTQLQLSGCRSQEIIIQQDNEFNIFTSCYNQFQKKEKIAAGNYIFPKRCYYMFTLYCLCISQSSRYWHR